MRWCFGVVLSVMVAAGSTFAATTGIISGTVTDASGMPLPGAAVMIEGTRLGASTDADGQYMILQVPPGEYTVTSQLIGFNPTSVVDVRVNADLTSRVNFRLDQEAIEIDAIIVTAQRDPIRVDVTSSQMIVDAQRVSEMPVNQMLDMLNYQPGVNVVRGNELEIRGGGPSEIRFQVDGVDRTDGLTGKGYTQLNQVLVSEVTLLTGGFNAEYGNVRSGMVNVVVKEGGERASMIPWVAAVVGYAPAQKKHFGPGGYDLDQYDYWRLLETDSAKTGGPIYWPDLYEKTSTDTAFMSYVDSRRAQYRVYQGWNEVVKSANSSGLRYGPPYMHNGWTVDDIKEAWSWETNLNEQVWQYSHQPDVSADIAMGWALPRKLGGLVLGYSYNREMTAVPALIPYYRDRQFEAKLTLTPVDNLKLNIGYMRSDSRATGASYGELLFNPEGEATKARVSGTDPVALRSPTELVRSVNEAEAEARNSKVNLSYSSPLLGEFNQIMGSLTYTFGPRTFVTASFGRSKSTWDLLRDVPRADKDGEGAFAPDAKWSAPSDWDYGAFLATIFTYTGDYTKPPSMSYATNPDSFLTRSPYAHPNAYAAPPTETKFITKTFTWGPRSWVPARGDRADATDDTTFNVTIVSPQGWVANPYSDLASRFSIGGGGEENIQGGGTQTTIRGDLTHVIGQHTLKTGLEYIGRDLDYLKEQSGGYFESGVGAGRNTTFRFYGNEYPAAQPKIIGAYIQDKYESDGMIANVGVRLESFDGGHPAWFYHNMFDSTVFGQTNSQPISRHMFAIAFHEAGLDSNSSLLGSIGTNFYTINGPDYLNGTAPMPWDVVRAWPSRDNKVYWRAAPRFGISHPVSNRTKFFFNYGVFYAMQKPTFMYGFTIHDGRPGGGSGRINYMYNANLRPSTTTMYEVGVEHVLPYETVFKVTGYQKYNEDQVTTMIVNGGVFSYNAYRNANYEDVRGYEFQIARNTGRFVNGAVTYESYSTRTGEVSVPTIGNEMKYFLTPFLPDVRRQPARGFFRVFLRLGTPMDWGTWSGGWSLGTEYSWQKGAEEIYNPNILPARELTEENYLPWVSTQNVNMKFSKQIPLSNGRFVTAYLDILNVLNTKHLNKYGVRNWQDYLGYVYTRRSLGEDVKVGDKSTFYVLTEPYKIDPNAALWNRPISAETDWVQFMNPRFYRFGVRFEI